MEVNIDLRDTIAQVYKSRNLDILYFVLLLLVHNLLSITDKHKRLGLEHKLAKLAKKFIRIKNHEIRDIKMLFSSYGISYIEAIGEADRWCAKLVSSGRAYACVSEDMDMFAYGCPFVLTGALTRAGATHGK